MRIFTAGCFDCIHIGHVNMLLFCRQLAGPNGIITVSLDSDTKMALEKRAPVFNLSERIEAIDSLTLFGSKVVNVTSVHNDNVHLYEKIKMISPDYIVAGSDYEQLGVVGSDVAKVIFFERDPRFSSTKIIQACRK